MNSTFTLTADEGITKVQTGLALPLHGPSVHLTALPEFVGVAVNFMTLPGKAETVQIVGQVSPGDASISTLPDPSTMTTVIC